MKMHPEDFAYLEAQLNKRLADGGQELINKYETGQIPNADIVKDLNKRFRWDLLWSVNIGTYIHELYTYLNDDHIDTALRRIVPEISKRY